MVQGGVSSRPAPAADLAQRLIQEAAGARRAGDLAAAEDLARQAVAAGTANHAALHLLSLILTEQGRADEAVAALTQAVAFRGDVAALRYTLGTALVAAGRFDEAATSLRKAVALDPAFAVAHSALGHLMLVARNSAEAETAFRHAIEADPALPDAHVGLGQALEAMGQGEAALSAYRTAIALRPELVRAQLHLIDLELALELYKEAEASAKRAAHVLPGVAAIEQRLDVARAAAGKGPRKAPRKPLE